MRNFGGGVYPVVVIWQNGVILKMTCVYQWSLKKATGTITTAKMKFLLGYNMKIVGGGGYETLVGNNNLVEGEESIGADFSSEVGGEDKQIFGLWGKPPSHLPRRGVLSSSKNLDGCGQAYPKSSQTTSQLYLKNVLFFVCG